MGTGNFTNQNDGEVANASDVQQVIDALKGDQVPRGNSGAPEDNSGSLGTSSFNFKRANITTGYFFAGMIMPVHTYNGTITPGQGWFPCDGSIINEANYNAIHGAGAWNEYVGASVLDGKYSPNLNDKYLTGASSTTQDGSSAINSVGNSGNTVDLSHTHTGVIHNHKWYDYKGNAVPSVTYQSNGSEQQVDDGRNKSVGGFETITVAPQGAGQDLSGLVSEELYTSNDGAGTTGSALGSSQDIQPESIEVQYYIRII